MRTLNAYHQHIQCDRFALMMDTKSIKDMSFALSPFLPIHSPSKRPAPSERAQTLGGHTTTGTLDICGSTAVCYLQKSTLPTGLREKRALHPHHASSIGGDCSTDCQHLRIGDGFHAHSTVCGVQDAGPRRSAFAFEANPCI